MTDELGLPRYVGEGMLLRWATPEDTDALAEFNIAMHSDDPEQPEEWVGAWTRLLMSGDHPTTAAGDFTVVVDENRDRRIASSCCHISQRWRYENVEFPAGRPELVATHPDYRRRGLVREQMDAIHALSASRGEMVTAITGIPWYYRQFGYEMTVNLHGNRAYPLSKQSGKSSEAPATFSWRQPTYDDIPLLNDLYAVQCRPSLLARIRDEAQWRWDIDQSNDPEAGFIDLRLIEDAASDVVGYCQYVTWGSNPNVGELAVLPGRSWRDVCLWLVQQFNTMSQERLAKGQQAFSRLTFELGEEHPAYDALDPELEPPGLAYAWYIRVPDLAGFLTHIAPVLEQRLAGSVMAGYTGGLAIDMYRSKLVMNWEAGRLASVEQTMAAQSDLPIGRFPDLTFLHLLFGHRTLAELEHAWVDCRVHNATARVLFGVLFPRRASCIIPGW